MSPETVRDFTGLAAQYGPFFFSIIFVLFIPILGQKWFSAMLQAKIKRDDERAQGLKVYKFYFVSSIVAGLALVAISTGWWFYVQSAYVLPAQSAAIDEKISEAINNRIYEGRITNVSPDDVFLDLPAAKYRLYTQLVENTRPLVYRYVIIFQHDPKKDAVVEFPYMTRDTFNKLFSADARSGVGANPERIPFCLTHKTAEVRLIRSDSAPPHFDSKCGQP